MDLQTASETYDPMGPGPKRGANLTLVTELHPRHAQTFDQIFTKPETIGLGVHHSATEPSLPAPSEYGSRRSSKMALKGIFGKGRGSREARADDVFEATPIEDGEEASYDHEPTRAMTSFNLEPRDRNNRMSKLKGIKRTPKIGSAWEPPALFQAYPQAVKEALLQAPVMDAEAVLRLDKMRKLTQLGSDPAATDLDGHGAPEDEQGLAPKKRGRKRGSSAVAAFACIPKLYILTTDGHLLQYSFEGQAERMPERMMKLTKDSAAFASDAIPGKHWVLQVSQTFNEEGSSADMKRPSMFSKLGFSNESKKFVTHFLLVMNSAEEMNAWLVTIRKEIQSLGGQAYRPDETVGRSLTGTAQSSRDQLVRGTQSGEEAFGSSPESVPECEEPLSASLMSSPPGSGLPPPSLSDRQSWNQRISIGSANSLPKSQRPLPSPTSKFQAPNSLLVQGKMPSASPSPRQAVFNLDKALPERPADNVQARVDALGIINADSLRLSAVAAAHSSVHKDDGPLSPRSFAGTPRSPHFPVSNYNPDAAKFSLDSPRLQPDTPTSDVSPSEPQRQTEAVESSTQQPLARNDSGSTRRTSNSASGRTPELTDGESLPQDSVLKEYMGLPTARSRSRSRSSSQRRNGADPATKWGLPYQAGFLPNPNIVLLPPPHPPPTTALPALPPGAVPHARPTSAQDNRPQQRRSISPAASRPKMLRRPSSMIVTSPTGTEWPANPFDSIAALPASTLRLPVPAPLTIKERRRLTQLSAAAMGPPASPAPSSPLPAPPSASPSIKGFSPLMGANKGPSPSIGAQVYAEHQSVSQPGAISVVKYDEMGPPLDTFSQFSPVCESWARYLERVGAA